MRRPIGCDLIMDFVGKSDIKILDSGCGTGNYTVELINKYGVRFIHCSDYSKGMLDEARNNVAALRGSVGDEALRSVTFSCDNVCDMPGIPSDSYDLVINNQVLHHLRPDNNFADMRSACREWARVLKTHGKISINMCTPKNGFEAYWWAELIPETAAKVYRRMPMAQNVTEALISAGFHDIKVQPLYDEILYDPNLYFNYMNFIDDPKKFGRSDSTFSQVSDEELQRAVSRLQAMIDDGTIDAWWDKKEKARLAIGQSVMIFAKKG